MSFFPQPGKQQGGEREGAAGRPGGSGAGAHLMGGGAEDAWPGWSALVHRPPLLCWGRAPGSPVVSAWRGEVAGCGGASSGLGGGGAEDAWPGRSALVCRPSASVLWASADASWLHRRGRWRSRRARSGPLLPDLGFFWGRVVCWLCLEWVRRRRPGSCRRWCGVCCVFLWRLELVVRAVVPETTAFCNDDVEELRWRRCVSPWKGLPQSWEARSRATPRLKDLPDLLGRRRRRPRVSCPSLEASLGVSVSPALLPVLVAVSGRKPRSFGSARWRRP
jgi:hypothetical protein